MLGYPYDTKGYKSYDITAHTVFVPQNVTFFEDIFPFQYLNHADTLVVPNSISANSLSHFPTAATPTDISIPPNHYMDITTPASSSPIPSLSPDIIPRHSTRTNLNICNITIISKLNPHHFLLHRKALWQVNLLISPHTLVLPSFHLPIVFLPQLLPHTLSLKPLLKLSKVLNGVKQ